MGATDGWGPEGGRPKISRLFFPLPLPFSLFFSLSLSEGLLVEFWWCLKRRDPHMCPFGVLGLSCDFNGKASRERKKVKMGAGD